MDSKPFKPKPPYGARPSRQGAPPRQGRQGEHQADRPQRQGRPGERQPDRPHSQGRRDEKPGDRPQRPRPSDEKHAERPQRPRPKDGTPPPTARPTNENESKIYGRSACAALWQNRADDIIRVYVTEERMLEFGPLLKWCARQKKAYHVLTPVEMERVSASVHHEGIVILAKTQRRLADSDLEARLTKIAGPSCLVFLDGVSNPHNVGSIIRVAAHFGVPLVLGRTSELPRMTPAAARIAEGGIEHVAQLAISDVVTAAQTLRRAGFKIVATSSHADTSLYGGPLPERAVIILGDETTGASRQLLELADHVVKIPGTGAVESLNVAVAAGLVLGEFWRRHKSGGA